MIVFLAHKHPYYDQLFILCSLKLNGTNLIFILVQKHIKSKRKVGWPEGLLKMPLPPEQLSLQRKKYVNDSWLWNKCQLYTFFPIATVVPVQMVFWLDFLKELRGTGVNSCESKVWRRIYNIRTVVFISLNFFFPGLVRARYTPRCSLVKINKYFPCKQSSYKDHRSLDFL